MDSNEKNREEIIPDFSHSRILLVDDNAINRQVALGFLKDTQAKVDTAENGLIALQKVQLNHYDLVLMDIQMPEMDGLAATKIIRNELNLTTLPIIALTAHAMAEDIEKSKQAGMCEHLSKPVSPEQLYTCLTKFLTGSFSLLSVKKSYAQCLCDYSYKCDDDKTLAKLIHIEALNPEQVLKKMGGRTKLYLSLVRDFYKSQRKIVKELEHVDENTQCEPLYRLIHTLKSNSAYIGAYDLVRLCNAFELSLENNAYPLSMLKSINHSLNDLLKQLSPIFAQSILKAHKVHFSKSVFLNILELILPKLKQSDFTAEELLPDLALLVTNSQYSQHIDELITLVDDVKYVQATGMVEDLLLTVKS